MHPDDFPFLKASAIGSKKLERYQSFILKLDAAIAEGRIRKVEYEEIKSELGRLVDRAYQTNVNEPYFNAGRWEEWGNEIYMLHCQCDPSNLHEVIACAKKLAKTELTGKPVDAMREVTDQLLPLANALKSLKAQIVLGRAPSTGPAKPENPNKIVRTCSCCFRAIAVQGNRMVHHGYRRPSWGYGQTASCPGIRYKPLERSNEGLVAMRNSSQRELEKLQEKWEQREQVTSIMTEKNRVKTTVNKGDPDWDRAHRGYVWKLDQAMRSEKSEIEGLDFRLSRWKQTEVDPERPDIKIEEIAPTPGPKP